VSSHSGAPTGTSAATPREWPASIVTRALAAVPASVTPNPSSARVRPRSIVSVPLAPVGHQVVAPLPSTASAAGWSACAVVAVALPVSATSTSGPRSCGAAGDTQTPDARTASTTRRLDTAAPSRS
jgi:hypothetical protein